jgi:hypothetical protein
MTFAKDQEASLVVTELEPQRVEQLTTMPVIPTLTYRFERAGDATRFTRRMAVDQTGRLRFISPLMQIMMRRSNSGYVARLKTVSEAQDRSPAEH